MRIQVFLGPDLQTGDLLSSLHSLKHLTRWSPQAAATTARVCFQIRSSVNRNKSGKLLPRVANRAHHQQNIVYFLYDEVLKNSWLKQEKKIRNIFYHFEMWFGLRNFQYTLLYTFSICYVGIIQVDEGFVVFVQ